MQQLQRTGRPSNTMQRGLNRGNAAARPIVHVKSASTSTSNSTLKMQQLRQPAVTFTSYEANTCTLDFRRTGVRMLVDPWFVGDLVFLEQEWLYRGIKREVGKSVKPDYQQIAQQADVLVLTQFLDDHTHMPTLREMPKSIPVIANPEAAERIAPLGFTNVTVLDHGQSTTTANGRLRITATEGALVGPPWSKRQNGYVFAEEVPANQAGDRGARIYFETHCDFTGSSLEHVGNVDMVISPVVSTLLGKGAASYPLVMGDINLIKLLRLLKPNVLLPLNNHEIDWAGPLGDLVFNRGDSAVGAVQEQLKTAGLGATKVVLPPRPGQACTYEL